MLSTLPGRLHLSSGIFFNARSAFLPLLLMLKDKASSPGDGGVFGPGTDRSIAGSLLPSWLHLCRRGLFLLFVDY